MSSLPTLELPSLRWGLLFCVACAAALLGGTVLPRALAVAYQTVAKHEHFLARKLGFLRARVRPRDVLAAEALALVSLLGAAAMGLWLYAVPPLLGLAFVVPVIERAVGRRIARIEAQLDPWLSGLASCLRVTPALGQALLYSRDLVSAPLREELDATLQDLELGVAVDEALARMGGRIGSRTVQSALGAMRVGRNSGGDLSEVLERSAAVLREMARLEGVFRTKTSEGRAQAQVVAVMPFALLALLHEIDPQLMAPLFANPRGHLVLVAAFVIWAASLFFAREILRVDY